MINRLGGIRQLAMVVKDADRTMRYLAKTLGIGPFFVVREDVPDDFRYRGHAAPAPVLTLCFAQAGPVQIELIQQHNATGSAYREFLGAGRWDGSDPVRMFG
jgi:methylmalonyl-CoA/ethylmalonyl-CoA epimerase